MKDKQLPRAIYSGAIHLNGLDIKVHVLDSGERVIEESDVAEVLNWLKNGGSVPELELGIQKIKSIEFKRISK